MRFGAGYGIIDGVKEREGDSGRARSTSATVVDVVASATAPSAV